MVCITGMSGLAGDSQCLYYGGILGLGSLGLRVLGVQHFRDFARGALGCYGDSSASSRFSGKRLEAGLRLQ